MHKSNGYARRCVGACEEIDRENESKGVDWEGGESDGRGEGWMGEGQKDIGGRGWWRDFERDSGGERER